MSNFKKFALATAPSPRPTSANARISQSLPVAPRFRSSRSPAGISVATSE